MKCFLFVIFLILLHGTLSDAYDSEEINKANNVIQESTNVLDSVNEIVNIANPAKFFGKISSVLGALGPAMMAVSAILSIITMFLPQEDSPELKALKTGFEKVNIKLDVMENAVKELKNKIELANVKAAIVQHITIIRSLYENLMDAQKDKSKKSYEYFAKQYDSQYKWSADNIYDAMTGSAGAHGFNLFNLYSESVKCNPTKVSKFCTIGMQYISQGIIVEGAYIGSLNLTAKSKKQKAKWEKKMKTLGENCQSIIQTCQDNWKTYSDLVFDITYKESLSLNNQDFAAKIADEVASVVPQRAWLAVVYNDASGFGQHCVDGNNREMKWNQQNRDVTLISTELAKPKTGNDYTNFQNLIETQKNAARTDKCFKDFPSCFMRKECYDLRLVFDVIRQKFYGGSLYAIHPVLYPGYKSTGNTLYVSDLKLTCVGIPHRLLAFV